MANIFDTAKNDIYLFEIIISVLVLFFGVFLFIKQLERNPIAWLLICVFATLKVVGSAINLAVAQQEANGKTPSTGLITAGYVCLNISLAPLLAATLRFIARGSESIVFPEGPIITPFMKRVGYLSFTLSAILSIVGFTDQDRVGGSSSGRAMSRASSILFLVAYLYLVVLALLCLRQVGVRYDPHFAVYLRCFLILIPCFFTLIIFSIVAAFTSGTDILAYHVFSIFNGSWAVYLIMYVLMGAIIALAYCVAGYLAELRLKGEGAEQEVQMNRMA